jgi:hypothetical protein
MAVEGLRARSAEVDFLDLAKTQHPQCDRRRQLWRGHRTRGDAAHHRSSGV